MQKVKFISLRVLRREMGVHGMIKILKFNKYVNINYSLYKIFWVQLTFWLFFFAIVQHYFFHQEHVVYTESINKKHLYKHQKSCDIEIRSNCIFQPWWYGYCEDNSNPLEASQIPDYNGLLQHCLNQVWKCLFLSPFPLVAIELGVVNPSLACLFVSYFSILIKALF